MKKNLTKIAAVASLATVLTPVVASANSVSTDIDHALRLEQTAHADGTQNDRIDWTGVTNTNLKDSGGYVYGAGTKVARSKQQGNYWLYLAETGTGVVHYGEVPEQYVTPTGQVTNHLDNYGSTVVINNSLRSNDSMVGELTPTNDAPTQTGSNNNYQEGNNSNSSSAQTGNTSNTSSSTTGNQGTQNPSAGSSSQAKPGTGATSGSQAQKPAAGQASQAKPGANTSSTSSSSASQAKPGTSASSSSSQTQPGHNVSGTVTGVAGNHDNGGATASSSSQTSATKPTGDKTSNTSQAQKPAAGQTSQAKPAGDKASSASEAKPAQGNDVKADAGKTANKVTDKKTPAKTQVGHHVVTAGETLSGIAQANGTTVGAIVKANPSITNPASVKVGTDLVMPAANGGQAVAPQGQSVAKAAPAATSQAQGSQDKASEKSAPAKGELLKTGAQDNEKGAVIASMSAVAGLVGLAALNRKKKFNY